MNDIEQGSEIVQLYLLNVILWASHTWDHITQNTEGKHLTMFYFTNGLKTEGDCEDDEIAEEIMHVENIHEDIFIFLAHPSSSPWTQINVSGNIYLFKNIMLEMIPFISHFTANRKQKTCFIKNGKA